MQMMGIILAGGASQVKELASYATASLPVAGTYEAIDFPLSSMVNSGINTVAVVSQFSSRALNHHLKDSAWWNFGRKNGGLYLVSPVVTEERQAWYSGTVEALKDALSVVEKEHEPYVVIASGDGVYNMDLSKVLDYHIEKNAEVTVVTTRIPRGRTRACFGQVICDAEGRITELHEKTMNEVSDEISCGIYIMRRRNLMAELDKAEAEGARDFVTEVLCPKLAAARVYAYHFDGYWNSITEEGGYYSCNMDFLKPDIRSEVLGSSRHVMTRVRDSASAKFLEGAEVRDSLVAEGAEIDGQVEHSVIFVKAKIGHGAVVRNSLVLPKAEVPAGAVVENCIYGDKPDSMEALFL